MALKHSQICNIAPPQLTNILKDPLRKVRLIDCRSFLEYNDNHIVGAVNICCSKLIKRRLQQEKISLKDLLLHCRIELEETSDVVVYDHGSSTCDDVTLDSFISILLRKLVLVVDKVYLLSGGFVHFYASYPELCENKVWKYPGLTALSQPCMPTTSVGPTRILPFLYLGSEEDANNKELLQSHNITYELNVSNKCAKPDFIPDGHFLRIPVNDSHNEKLVPFLSQTFQFIEKVRGSNESVLVHCLAGISRSPTVAIAYVMRHLRLTCEDAYRYVKAKRATISPNFNFLGQLLEYEKQLISENVIEKKPVPPQIPYAPSQSSEFSLGSPPLLSPLPTSTSTTKATGKRFNLSLRFSPFCSSSGSQSSPKDASPTSAMARLQFDKPHGKENRTGGSGCGTSTSTGPGALGLGVGFTLTRPTRLVKEQHVGSIQEEEAGTSWDSLSKSLTKQSFSISFSKGSKNRRSSVEQFQHSVEHGGSASHGTEDEETDTFMEQDPIFSITKKCRVHKINVEGEGPPQETDRACHGSNSPLVGTTREVWAPNAEDKIHRSESCTSNVSTPSGSSYQRGDYQRSDSVSTSGVGSEISDQELGVSGSWEITDSGIQPDDGVFSDSHSLYSKSPRSSRHLQLWSSGSSTDDGVSCCSSTVEMPSASSTTSTSGFKSPEKRKSSEVLVRSGSRLSVPGFEKRRSYAECVSGEWRHGDTCHPKRWSLAENLGESPIGDRTDESAFPVSFLGMHKSMRGCSRSPDRALDLEQDCRTNSPLSFGHHWVNLLSGRELTCCESRNVGLYRVHSCPGMIGYRDWIQIHNQVPETPPEPISDSVLLQMRKCRNRSKHQSSFDDQPNRGDRFQNRFSCGSIDYDELLSKLKRVQESKDNKSDSPHSSSSTLASSSFSIVVQ